MLIEKLLEILDNRMLLVFQNERRIEKYGTLRSLFLLQTQIRLSKSIFNFSPQMDVIVNIEAIVLNEKHIYHSISVNIYKVNKRNVIY
jgi:hypothetical protein